MARPKPIAQTYIPEFYCEVCRKWLPLKSRRQFNALRVYRCVPCGGKDKIDE